MLGIIPRLYVLFSELCYTFPRSMIQTLHAEGSCALFVMKQDGKKPKYGWLLGDKVGEIGGNVFGRYGARKRKRLSRT